MCGLISDDEHLTLQVLCVLSLCKMCVLSLPSPILWKSLSYLPLADIQSKPEFMKQSRLLSSMSWSVRKGDNCSGVQLRDCMWLQGDLKPMTRVGRDAWCLSTCQREFLPKSTSDPHWDYVGLIFTWCSCFFIEGIKLSGQKKMYSANNTPSFVCEI